MLSLISPSKDLDFKIQSPIQSLDIPRLWNRSLDIVQVMKFKKPNDLKKLMDISDKLAIENVRRFQEMSIEFNSQNSKPAIYAFSGDVYRGLDSNSLEKNEIDYCQKNLRILSGLYGLLNPLDLIQPYRLEMGLSLKIKKFKNLYQFWGEHITQLINDDIAKIDSPYLVNLASTEYFKSVNISKLTVPVLNIHFREFRNNKLSFLSYNAKKARGLMARYMAIHKVKKLNDLCAFNSENYCFDSKLSNDHELFFVK